MMTPSLFLFAVATPEDGLKIAVSGMLIVSAALILISLFIAALPNILAILADYLPEKEESHGSQSHPESLIPDDEAVLAAIGFVLHNRQRTEES